MQPIAHKNYEVRLTSPLPIAFILLWSSGYIGGAFGVRYGEPFTMTFYRFALAALVFLGVALAIKASGPGDLHLTFTRRPWACSCRLCNLAASTPG